MLREEIIDKYFINVSLDKNYLDVYYVRRSILQALEVNLVKFQGVVLDVGCGIMPYRDLILKRNKSVTSYIGLDFENSLDPEYALGKPDLFWKGDVIPMEDNSVEIVLATELFEHCQEPEKVMIEILRVLKPGGVLFLTVPFLWNLHLVPYDEYRFTPFSLNRHLINSGFVDVKLKALGGLDASLAQMLGIWYQNRPMRPAFKKFIGSFLLRIIKRLILADSKVNNNDLFKDGSMITGLSGIASKPLN
jgi:ubiquinone/menaquinone biosynthesis C-methylase UbiE